MELFDAAYSPPAASEAAILALWTRVTDHDHSSDTADALRQLPEVIRANVEAVAKHIFREEFFRTAGRSCNVGVALNVIVHNAKLIVFSHVGHLAYSPWHLADAAVLKRIASDLRGETSMESAVRHMAAIKCCNLFVAALESDDRGSYLQSVKGLVARHPVRSVVLDAELIEWSPQEEFLDACATIGLRPAFVGIADRKTASSHSLLSQATRGTPALILDTSGRALAVSRRGEVQRPEPTQTARQGTSAASRSNQAVSPPVAAPRPPVQATVPPSPMQARIQALRDTQARRTARP